MSGHPSDVSAAPVHVVIFQVEHVLCGRNGAGHIATGRVDDPFRLPGRAGGVQDKKHIFRIHFLRFTVRTGFLHQPVVPMVPAFLDAKQKITPFDDNDMLNGRSIGESNICVVFQRNDTPPAVTSVGGYEKFCLSVIYPFFQRLWTETREHDGMNGADAGAGKHGYGKFGYHREIYGDPVAFFDSEIL